MPMIRRNVEPTLLNFCSVSFFAISNCDSWASRALTRPSDPPRRAWTAYIRKALLLVRQFVFQNLQLSIFILPLILESVEKHQPSILPSCVSDLRASFPCIYSPPVELTIPAPLTSIFRRLHRHVNVVFQALVLSLPNCYPHLPTDRNRATNV